MEEEGQPEMDALLELAFLSALNIYQELSSHPLMSQKNIIKDIILNIISI